MNLLNSNNKKWFRKRFLTRFLTLFVTMATLAMGLTLISSTPASAAVSVPHTSDFSDNGPDDLDGDWTREGTNCSWRGCWGETYYFSDEQGAISWWYIGDIQGEFKLQFALPEGKNESRKNATGKVRWSIYEKRPSANVYTVIWSSTSSQENKVGWWGWPDIFLDGKVWVKAEVLSGYAAVDDIRLRHEDVLPAHKELATEMCLLSGAAQQAVAAGVLTGALITIATAGIGTVSATAGIAYALAGGMLSVAALEYLIDHRERLMGYGACKYKNPGVLSWLHSYIAFSNDIAELTANHQSYEALGATFCLSRGANVSKYDPVKVGDSRDCP